MLRSRLFWRLYWGHVILILMTTAVIGVLVARWLEKESVDETERLLQTQALLIRDTVGPDPQSWQDPLFRERLSKLSKESGTRYTLIRADGVVAADTWQDPSSMENHSMRPEIVQAGENGVGTSTRYSQTIGMDMMYVAMRVSDDNGRILGYVRAAIPLAIVDRRLGYLAITVALSAALAIALALLVGLFVAGRTSRDIRYLNDTVKTIASGDYSRKIRLSRRDEVGDLAKSVAVMSDQLADRLGTITGDRNRLAAILAGMVEGVIAIDADDRVLHMNKVAGGLLAVDPESSIGRKVWEVLRVPSLGDTILKARQSGRSAGESLRIFSDKGSMTVEMHASPMLDSRGEIAGAVMVLHDITELRRLEDIRKDFAANAAHELQTPLTAIRGLVETILEDKSMDPGQQRKFLDKIGSQVTRLSSIVTDLLALSKAESKDELGQPEAIDIRLPVKDSINASLMAAEAKSIAVETDLPESPVIVKCYPGAIQQIAGNLLSNAIKYTPDGGQVRVTVRAGSSTAILEVRDTGIGIEAKDIERIFERFYRVDKGRSREMGGTGLGLSIARHVARSLGGDVGAESSPGRGSTFTVTLPLSS